MQNEAASIPLLKEIELNGWKNVPRVPIFEIPENLKTGGWYYILMDGNYRRDTAVHLGCSLPVLVYRFGEPINVEKDGLAPFRHSTEPRLYQKLVNMFLLRGYLDDIVSGRMNRITIQSRLALALQQSPQPLLGFR